MRHEYKYDLVDGHIIVRDGASRLLIDTGAPSSVGEASSLAFAGETRSVAQDYMGVTPAFLGSKIGSPVHALIGADILNRFDVTIDPSQSVVTLNEGEEHLIGEPIPLDDFMGIPIVLASIGGQTIRVFFDTGAKLSYLAPEITAAFPRDGAEQDFYPGLGSFQTDTFTVPISVGSEQFVLRVGVLPELLQMALMKADTGGILGTAVLESHSVCLAPRRGTMRLTKLSTQGPGKASQRAEGTPRLTANAIMEERKTTAKRKPRRCPNCGAAQMASILYGLPDFSSELQRELDEGKTVLGGCCIMGCDPAWQCTRCQLQVYREADVLREEGRE